ncbi:MAG TPA: DoxX family protein [Candidatus Polarisedimenticolia bacterium]|nr:DoxX family protein [Candidatus Polarisedimenticolia bacterium]
MMERWLGTFSELIYSMMRAVVGLLFACHGAQKLFGALGGQSQVGNPMMTIAGIIEFFGGLAVAVGLSAGYAAFLASGLMASAYFMAHAPNGFWPIVNKGELAAVYCFVFLFIASRGSGRYSVDALAKRRR